VRERRAQNCPQGDADVLRPVRKALRDGWV